jgi:signal transduction histidine kinase
MKPKEPVNILLVDDQPAKLLTYETILADLGEKLIRANSGQEALELLLKHEIAVVLVDVCMPGLDGFELASMIRNHPRFQRTAIILVSGVLVEDDDRLKGYDSGALDYISVPIVPGLLRAKVAVFADLYRKTKELQLLNQELERRVAERTAEIEASAARLRQSEARLRLVLAAASIQGWTWDIHTDELVWVESEPDGEPKVERFSDFLYRMSLEDQVAVRHAINRALSGPDDFSAEFRTLDGGTELWWLGRGTVITDASGQPVSIAGININITERKRAEEERAILLKNAEEARREAERANVLKDEFLAILSHELRTPLNAITGWAHMLHSGGLDPQMQIKAVETINRNALLQARLISDLLDISRIVSGRLRLDFTAVDLPSVMQAAVDAVRPEAEKKKLELEAIATDTIDPIAGDPARLQQVFSNLLSNAIKFTPANGHVRLQIERVNSHVQVIVEDDGPGIRPDFLPHIFERFRQGDASTTRAHQGLGLGLAIVRHLVELHGGRIHAANRVDRKGAVFTVLLPVSASLVEALSGARKGLAVTPSGENGNMPASLLEGTHVLVVDDEPDAREVVALTLERAGAKVATAASAPEAIRLFEEALPDVLVADIEMPGEDGYSLIERIRSLPQGKGGHTPAVALTAYASASDRERLFGAGFHRHVPKPVQPRDLVIAVATLARFSESVRKLVPAAQAASEKGG